MSVDFPRAWEIGRDPDAVHDPGCSHELTGGALLCDCHVLHEHPEYRDQTVLYTTGGEPYRRDSGSIDGGFLLAFAVIIAVVLVYVAAGGAR